MDKIIRPNFIIWHEDDTILLRKTISGALQDASVCGGVIFEPLGADAARRVVLLEEQNAELLAAMKTCDDCGFKWDSDNGDTCASCECDELRDKNAELLTILKRVRVTKAIKNYSLVKAIEAAIRKAGE